MKKHAMIVLALLMTFWTGNYASAKVNTVHPSRIEVFTFMHDAFQAQLKLSEAYHTKAETERVLTPYFSKSYTDQFLKENVVKEAQGYISYGGDLSPYYIPYFSYNDDTKMIYDDQKHKLYVYEYFPDETDGPVKYGDHYEMITLKLYGPQWKIVQYTFSKEKPVRSVKTFHEIKAD
ncbi:DUF3993 domain-containing protein [Priestia koreensis]|uniref:DUF3993 domain-containing protein n=1 Tax=Priestia koreensis TaxID=284581 RepID=UPI003457DEE5